MMSAIRTSQLTRRYGRRLGVDHVDLEVPDGAVFGFLGPNGAGKTTTIRVLLGFLRPTEGEASIYGLDCWRRSHVIKREVGYLPGDLRLYPWMTGRSTLRTVARIRGRRLSRAGDGLAERFRLDLGVPVRKMSRGMRQKLGLILALAHEPRLLVLDEPTSGLDPLMRDELLSCLREFGRRGHTVFFSSHVLGEVEHLCDRVAIVREGRIVADETLEALRSRARREVVIEFTDPEHAAGTAVPGFLTLLDRDGPRWRAELTGRADRLVAWCAGRSIRDLAIGQPDLETLFRQFYRVEEMG